MVVAIFGTKMPWFRIPRSAELFSPLFHSDSNYQILTFNEGMSLSKPCSGMQLCYSNIKNECARVQIEALEG